MQSLTLLTRFSAAMEGNADAALAVAGVDSWGRVAGLSYGDDWPHTMRGQYAQIDGPIHLVSSHADQADALAERYGVPVKIGSSAIQFVER